MRNVLVISSSEWPVAALRAALGDDIDELRVVVPAVHQSRLQWLTNADDDARERADDAASSIADALPSQRQRHPPATRYGTCRRQSRLPPLRPN